MNVSFSTRGWQQIPWEQQVQMAETMRFGGVELYNVHKTPELTGRGGPLHRYTAAATARELWQKGLCIPCFDTACDIAGEDCTETVTALMQLAHDVQCPYVSVTARRDDDARISAALEALLPAAEAQGITILLKTSGVFSDTARLRALLDAFACDQLGALWDSTIPTGTTANPPTRPSKTSAPTSATSTCATRTTTAAMTSSARARCPSAA